MYQITLNDEDSARLKKIVKQMMIKEDLTISDMAERLGCSRQYLYNYMSGKGSNKRKYRFLQAALVDELNITVGRK